MAMEQYSRLKLEFDQITGAMKFVGQEAVSLQKQVRLLRQELTLGSYTEKQFSQIQRALQETEIKLKQSQLRGQDLFQQIGTLGGGFGELSNRIDRAIKLLGAFSNISFDELKQQFKTLAAQITGNVEGISDSIEKIETGGRPRGTRESVGSVGDRGLSTLISGAAGAAAGAAAGGGGGGSKGILTNPQDVIDSVITEKNNKILKERETVLKSLAKANVDYQQSQIAFQQLIDRATTGIENEAKAIRNSKNIKVEFIGLNEKETEQLLRKQLQLERAAEFEKQYIAGNKESRKKLAEAFYEENKAIEMAQASYFEYSAGLTEVEAQSLILGRSINTLEKNFKDVSFVVEEGVIMMGRNDEALRALSEAEMACVLSGQKLVMTTEGQILTQQIYQNSLKKSTAETLGYTTGVKLAAAADYYFLKSAQLLAATFNMQLGPAIIYLNRAITALGVTLSIVTGVFAALAVAKFVAWAYQAATGFAKMEAEATQVGVTIGNIQKLLEMDLAREKNRNAERIAEMKKNNATSAEIRKQEIKDSKVAIQIITDALNDARNKQFLAQRKTQESVGLFGISEEAAEQQVKNYKDATDLVLKLEKDRAAAVSDIQVKDKQDSEATRKKKDADILRDLDARIEQEIEKVGTQSKVLVNLYTERNNLVDKMNVDIDLSDAERNERKRIQNKKINDAIIEDRLRVLQAESDSIARQIEVIEKGSDEEYELRRNLAKANRDIAVEDAKKDEKTRENNEKNANTKLAKDLIEIDKMYYRDKMELRQTELNSLYEGTVKFYDKERELEQEAYRLKLIDAKNNAELIEALTKEHKRRLLEIDAKEIDAKADIEKQKADVAMSSLKIEEVGFLESFGIIREANKKKFQDLADSENLEYEARKIRAKGNAEQLEIIEKDHVLKLGEIEVQRVVAAQQTNQLIIDSVSQFGAAISGIGEAIMEDAQGRDEKQFESAKNIAKGGVIVEKAAAIGQIWSNNAVANAKATAAFPLTGGQPWVTINTVTAGLSTITTVAAAAKAIAEIDNKKFDKPKGGSSGRNYATGGMIDGPRHSQGGVPIEAEGGEAIMTRGAVTAFAPLLSAINQMGGGTSFSQGAVGQAGYDFPEQSTQQVQQAQITKTYVVENELTTIQQRQARLKDLSTL